EQHEARRVAIDSMDNERTAASAPAQILLEILEHRPCVLAASDRQRHGEDPGGLVENDDRVVLVDDWQVAVVAQRRATLRAAGPTRPVASGAAALAPAAGAGGSHSARLTDPLPAPGGGAGFGARAGAPRARQILVEPHSRRVELHGPHGHGSGHDDGELRR